MRFLSRVKSPRPVLFSKRTILRAPSRNDYAHWVRIREESREFLRPWEPLWPEDDLSPSAWRERMRRYRRERRHGSGLPLFVFINQGTTLVGGINLGNVRRGVAQSAQIGYWMGEEYAGQGYMGEALESLVRYAFQELGLHRLEAACIPKNNRSIRLLEKAGFEREGLLCSYLRIAGMWQDHYLYARINDADDRYGKQNGWQRQKA